MEVGDCIYRWRKISRSYARHDFLLSRKQEEKGEILVDVTVYSVSTVYYGKRGTPVLASKSLGRRGSGEKCKNRETRWTGLVLVSFLYAALLFGSIFPDKLIDGIRKECL